MNFINCIVIVRSAAFHSQNQVFLLPEIDAFCNRGRATLINRKLQERPQPRERENIYVPVEVPAVYSNQEIAGCTGECIEVVGESRIAKVSRSNRSHHFICAYG